MDKFETNIFRILSERYGIIGESELLRQATLKLIQAAPTDLTVLITGDTGTGKEVFANALHGLSERKKFPFVSVNCGAIPETLLESELFGNEKGAFTGAVDQRIGFFESANKGTIFLDEIGEMPISTQVKLLRILESGEFTRLGSSALRRVDVRIIAATNRNLELEVAEGRFRQDLYFRLKSVHIILPKLSKHPGDIPLLIDYFAEKVCSKLGIEWNGISDEALQMLKTLPWNGNIRELRNMIESIVTLEKVSYITMDILQKYIPAALPPAFSSPVAGDLSLVPLNPTIEKGMELELIFHSLLDLKHEVADIRRFLHAIAINISDLKDRIINPVQDSFSNENIPVYEEENLNLEEMEKKIIIESLRKYNGNRRMASQAMGISERTLYRKIIDYGISI